MYYDFNLTFRHAILSTPFESEQNRFAKCSITRSQIDINVREIMVFTVPPAPAGEEGGVPVVRNSCLTGLYHKICF